MITFKKESSTQYFIYKDGKFVGYLINSKEFGKTDWVAMGQHPVRIERQLGKLSNAKRWAKDHPGFFRIS